MSQQPAPSNIAWSDDVPWYAPALAAAHRRGIVDEINAIARVFRDGREGYAAGPEVDRRTGEPYPGRIRVTDGVYSAILGHAGVVLGYGVASPEDVALSREAATKTLPKPTSAYRRGTARRRGPSDWDELVEWLAEAHYTTQPLSGGHIAVRDPKGHRIATFPSTPSDSRSFANAVAMMRRLTGLDLRR